MPASPRSPGPWRRASLAPVFLDLGGGGQDEGGDAAHLELGAALGAVEDLAGEGDGGGDAAVALGAGGVDGVVRGELLGLRGHGCVLRGRPAGCRRFSWQSCVKSWRI